MQPHIYETKLPSIHMKPIVVAPLVSPAEVPPTPSIESRAPCRSFFYNVNSLSFEARVTVSIVLTEAWYFLVWWPFLMISLWFWGFFFRSGALRSVLAGCCGAPSYWRELYFPISSSYSFCFHLFLPETASLCIWWCEWLRLPWPCRLCDHDVRGGWVWWAMARVIGSSCERVACVICCWLMDHVDCQPFSPCRVCVSMFWVGAARIVAPPWSSLVQLQCIMRHWLSHVWA